MLTQTHTSRTSNYIGAHQTHFYHSFFSPAHILFSNLLVLVFLCCVHDCTLNKFDALKSVFKRHFSVAFLFFIFHPLQLCLTHLHRWVLPTSLPGWKTASSPRLRRPGLIVLRRTWQHWASDSTRRNERARDFRSCSAAVGSACLKTWLTPKPEFSTTCSPTSACHITLHCWPSNMFTHGKREPNCKKWYKLLLELGKCLWKSTTTKV